MISFRYGFLFDETSHLDFLIQHFSYHSFLFRSIPDLPDKTFYPTVSAVYGNTEVSMVYLGHPLDG